MELSNTTEGLDGTRIENYISRKPEEKFETVEFEISDDLFLKVAKAAHDRDITFNTMVNIIMKKSIEDLEYRFDHDPKPAFLTEDN